MRRTPYYMVTGNHTQIQFFFFATKREALAHKQEWLKETPDGDCEITKHYAEISRKGMVRELNWVISLTCFNEG